MASGSTACPIDSGCPIESAKKRPNQKDPLEPVQLHKCTPIAQSKRASIAGSPEFWRARRDSNSLPLGS